MFTILAVAYVVVSGPAPEARRAPRPRRGGGRRRDARGGAGGARARDRRVVGVGGSLLVLVPGLVLVGAGIGLCFTPLTSTVLGTIEPAAAGAASGAMSTTQQVGYALGVAITGVIFFGVGEDHIARAFAVSLLAARGARGRDRGHDAAAAAARPRRAGRGARLEGS